jgi:hypothetical protein
MALAELNQKQIQTLDYILNYQPDERVQYSLDEDLIESVEDYIVRVSEVDDYSNSYEILEIPEGLHDEVRETLKEELELELQGALESIFEDRTADAFQFFKEVKRSEDQVIQASSHRYLNLERFLDELEEAGFGFIQYYYTTTDNRKMQFAFRRFPEDGRLIFEQEATEIVRESLQDLSPAEMWAAYANSYLSENRVMENLGGFSPDEIEEALDNPKISAKEEISFLNEQIVDLLRERLYELIHEDTTYLSTIEFLRAGSDDNDGSRVLNNELVDNVSHGQKERLTRYIDRLLEYGLIFKRSDRYILSDEVLRVLDEAEERAKIEAYPIRSKPQAQKVLQDILTRTDEEIKIIDRYFDDTALQLIERTAPPDVRKVILYGEDDRSEDIQNVLNKELTDDSQYRIKKMADQDEPGIPHDRFIIIDNAKVWQVGHSLNGLGNDFSTIFAHTEEDTSEYIQLFDELWQQGKELHNPDAAVPDET